MLTALQDFPLDSIRQVQWISCTTYSQDGHTLNMAGCNQCSVTQVPMVPTLLNRSTDTKLQKTVCNSQKEHRVNKFGCVFIIFFNVLLIVLYKSGILSLVASTSCTTFQNKTIYYGSFLISISAAQVMKKVCLTETKIRQGSAMPMLQWDKNPLVDFLYCFQQNGRYLFNDL